MKKIIFKLINIDILIKVLYGKIILILIFIYKILPKQFQFCNTGVKNLEDLKKYSRNNLYKLLNNFFYFDLDLDIFLHRNFFQK